MTGRDLAPGAAIAGVLAFAWAAITTDPAFGLEVFVIVALVTCSRGPVVPRAERGMLVATSLAVGQLWLLRGMHR